MKILKDAENLVLEIKIEGRYGDHTSGENLRSKNALITPSATISDCL